MKDHTSFYKKNPSDQIFWIDQHDRIGWHLFTFDKKKIYNLFADYPHNMKEDERKIFDRENPEWADFFKDRRLLLLINQYNQDKKDPSIAQLIMYAKPDFDEALKIMERVIKEGRELVPIYPGLDERPVPGMILIGSIPDGGLYIK